MPAQRARRADLSSRAARPDGVIYRPQDVRCGKVGCRRCAPTSPDRGPYCMAYWDYRRLTSSFYVGKTLPAAVEFNSAELVFLIIGRLSRPPGVLDQHGYYLGGATARTPYPEVFGGAAKLLSV